ncbi:MAG: DMT family transporter [Rhodothalassiaceae bacterium]
MTPIRAPQAADWFGLLALSLAWGTSFLAVEIALTGFSPLVITASRIGIATILLLGIVRLRGQRMPRRAGDLGILLAAGTIGATIPFLLISYGQTGTDSSSAAILMAATPLAAALLTHVATGDEKLSTGKLAGIALGLAGVFVLVGGADFRLEAGAHYELSVLGGAVCYAVSSLLMRRASHVPTVVGAAGAMAGGAVTVIPLALVFGHLPDTWPPLPALLAVLWLSVVPSALAVLVMMWMLGRVGVTFMTLNNYLVPVVGSLLGVLVLGESFGLKRFSGLVLILGGVLAVHYAHRRALSLRERA